jgi:hypothetical protein
LRSVRTHLGRVYSLHAPRKCIGKGKAHRPL